MTSTPSWGVDLVLFDGEELVFGNNQPRSASTSWARSNSRTRYARAVASGRTTVALCRRASCSTWSAGATSSSRGTVQQRARPRPGSTGLVRGRQALQSEVVHQLRRTRGHDDHLPLNEVAGIPTIDIIDFEYPFWHKADDLPENCSAESLEEVGQVVTAWLAANPAGAAPAPERKKR